MAAIAAVAVLPMTGGLALADAAPAQATSCAVNNYRVNHTPSAVWDYDDKHWIKDKKAGDAVKGPNSNVMDNYSNGWRVVYLGGGGVAWMWADYLTYINCD